VTRELPGSPLGLHRVIEPAGALPQAAWRLDPSPELWPDETRVRVDRLNLDAASFRQLTGTVDGDPAKLRAAVLGVDRVFGRGTTPREVASYLVHALAPEPAGAAG
jgi:L-erythro-3,5-diaminohexanoate dehydrogenase